jgi:uroporphyrinogen-III synthase
MDILIAKKIGSVATVMVKDRGWNYDVVETLNISFIDISAIDESNAWIISSRNSLHAIKKFIGRAPADIYCIGDWMKRQLQAKNVQSRIESFDNIKSLVERIRELEFEKVLYFCGDHHRMDLTHVLSGISIVNKVITHRSEKAYPRLDKTYDAIMVFSPRSAESLLKHNTFSPDTIFGCIGPTTESYLHGRGITNTFCASSPDSEILIKEFCNNYTL